MKKENEFSIWERDPLGAASATYSERYLARLGRRAFLNFWSYSNPYTDEGGGKELCDFLVVFGNDIIIFSDKHCEFSQHDDIKVAWHRWYRSAIEKSIRQLHGAASFMDRFPKRIYLDRSCKHPLPISLPPSNVAKVHLIAVTRGSADAAKKFWKNTSSSSLFTNTTLKGLVDRDHPFMVGRPVHRKRFLHILDELTLDILLKELDTVSDFVTYLAKKEEFLSSNSSDFLIAGEEELLATYLLNPLPNFEGFSFPSLPSFKKVVQIEEGAWDKFSRSKEYSLWKKIMEPSYEWDRLIENQTSHIKKHSAEVLYKHDADFDDIHVHEIVLRMMAQERRAIRKSLAENHREVQILNLRKPEYDRFTRVLLVPPENKRVYVFLVLIRAPEQKYREYREARRLALAGYCRSVRLRVPGIEEVVGVASDELSSAEQTQDFLYMQFGSDFSSEEKKKDLALLREAGIWKEEWTCA